MTPFKSYLTVGFILHKYSLHNNCEVARSIPKSVKSRDTSK